MKFHFEEYFITFSQRQLTRGISIERKNERNRISERKKRNQLDDTRTCGGQIFAQYN